MRNFSISGVDVEKWGWRRYHLRIYILFLHTWSGSKANISITCNWAPLTDHPNCSYNYMFWLLTQGRYSALSSEKVISHTCPSGFICISFRFLLSDSLRVSPIPVYQSPIYSQVSLWKVLLLFDFWLSVFTVQTEDRSFRCQEPTAPMGNYVNYVWICDWHQPR